MLCGYGTSSYVKAFECRPALGIAVGIPDVVIGI